MDSLLSGLAAHGYSILFLAVFLETVGFPIPAALALLIAGGTARASLHPLFGVAGAFAAMVLGDTLMFFLGRYTGWWLLGVLCRLSLNPESCILRSADAFYRRGRMLLVLAKFVPGINTMAPPLAGSMGMRFLHFLRLDAAGAGLYIGCYWSVGFLFAGALGAITKGYQAFGRIAAWALIVVVGGYLAYHFWILVRARSLRPVPFVSPADAARAMADGAVIYDVRSHSYYDPKATRIQGSQRLEPSAVNQLHGELPMDRRVFLYCTCVREATSARVAQVLKEKGVQVAVIKGGLRAWKKAGLPLEPVPPEEIAELPVFES
ncbi:MAG TPA: rhodanese-like domain-containing protein [Bryobacteraceae bacterium]